MPAFAFPLTGLVTVLTMLVMIWIMMQVGKARSQHQIPAPTMDGPEAFLRVLRVQANSVEQIVMFLPMLWLFANLAGDFWAACVGVLFPIGRVVYAQGYIAAANKRSTGFLIGAVSVVVLTLGSLYLLVRSLFM
jgi:glutathione S-transferase